MQIKITRVDKSLPLPEYQTPGAVAFDMYSRIDAEIAPAELCVLPSNLIIQVPEGHVLIMANRSSGPRKGITLPNGVGVIDQDYNGPEDEIKIVVYNFKTEKITIKRGDRIAQGLIVPIVRAEFFEGEPARKDSRGGLGSTG
ncbi:MAG: dUTP diphosphatase [Candidatus Liptonbacteria bacterium]